MPLLALPNELLDQICSYLEHRKHREAFLTNYSWETGSTWAPPSPYYVGQFRLACRVFAAIGIPYLAREVTLVATPQSMCRLLRLSHSVLGTNVRSLRISCFMHTQLGNYKRVRECFVSGLADTSSPEFLDTLPAFYAYNSLCYSQQKLVQAKSHPAFLRTLLSKLSNLETITIFDEVTREIVPRDIAPCLAVRYNAKSFLGHGGNWSLQSTFASQVLDCVLLTIKDLISVKAVRCFTLNYAYASFGFSKENIISWKSALESLECLKLSQAKPLQDSGAYGYRSISGDPRGDICGRMLASTIAAARNVNEFDLRLTEWDLNSNEVLDAKSYWPFLKKLTLTSLHLDRDHMLDFFKRQGRTLEILDLRYVWLDPDQNPADWTDFFERAFTESLFNLKSLRLHNVSDISNGFLYCRDWEKICINAVRPDRAIRYLMCGQKSNMDGKIDELSLHPYFWHKVSWESIMDTCKIAYEEHIKVENQIIADIERDCEEL
ncbi:hypothetical protein MMC10_006653 [Thelotrema lepadinum]|nr:hypothetical protein [Thelotrema lepadinum]